MSTARSAPVTSNRPISSISSISSIDGQENGESSTNPERVGGTTHNGSQSAPLVSKIVCGVDDLKEVSEAEGWTIDYDQIQAGPLVANTNARTLGDISLLDEAFNLRLEVVGTTPSDYVTVAAPCDSSELWLNGRILDKAQICLLAPGSEMHAVSGEDSRLLSMHIPVELVEGTASALLNDSFFGIPDGGLFAPIGSVAGEHLQQLMRSAIYEPRCGSWQLEQMAQLTEFMITSVSFAVGDTDEAPGNMTAAMSVKTISRAREFIESNLCESMSMLEISAYAATSLSKLERLFQRELGLTPSQYVLARRLQATRRSLERSSAGHSSVAMIANDFGFHHLGRFSGAYREQFGELPSETLREPV